MAPPADTSMEPSSTMNSVEPSAPESTVTSVPRTPQMAALPASRGSVPPSRCRAKLSLPRAAVSTGCALPPCSISSSVNTVFSATLTL